ncbi:hypothetical protein D3C71_1724750 [compost metagenome]
MVPVIHKFEVIERVIENAVRLAADNQLRQLVRLTGQLGRHLLQMIGVDVHIAARPNKFTRCKSRLMGDHMGQQRIAGNIERKTEERVHRSHGQHAAQLAVRHIELKDEMAGRQLHLVNLPDIPGADDMSAGIGASADRFNNL